MPIVVPGRRIGTAYTGGATAAKKKLKRGKRPTNLSLMLTPMVDMFTILVLYLIQQFSSSGQILFIDPNLKLPQAARAVDMIGNPPVVTISCGPNDAAVGSQPNLCKGGMISVQGKPVEPTNQLATDGYWSAPHLQDKLRQMRDLSNKVAQASRGTIVTESANGVLIIQADVGVPFILLKKVLKTANDMGYAQVNFAVARKGSSEVAVAPGKG